MKQEQLIKTKATAATLGCSVWTVRQLVRRGLIPAVRLVPRGAWHFDPADVRRFIRERKAQ